MKDKYKTKGQLIRELEELRKKLEKYEGKTEDPRDEISSDEDERLWPEKKLEVVEKKYRSLLETNLYGIQEIDIYGIITFMNSVQCRILGYSSEELKGKQIWDILAADSDRDDLTEYLTRVAEGEYTTFGWTGNFVRKDETIIELHIDWRKREDNQGRVTGFVSVINDILEYEKPEVSKISGEAVAEVISTGMQEENLQNKEKQPQSQEEMQQCIENLKLPEDEKIKEDKDFSTFLKLDEIQELLETIHQEFENHKKVRDNKNKVIDRIYKILIEHLKTYDKLQVADMEKATQDKPDLKGDESDIQDAILKKLDALEESFHSRFKHDEHKNKIIDKLHGDLQDYKNDFLKKYLNTMVMDVIQLIDNHRKLVSYYDTDNPSENDPVKLLGLLKSVPTDLEDLFFRHGVRPFTCEGEEFDPTKQRVLKVLNTNDKEKDKKVAESLRPGYEWDGKVIRPEMVAAYVFEQSEN